MPQASLATQALPFYSFDELVDKRRSILRYAHSFPPATERNRHRQIALSLRALFRTEDWLAAHTRED